MDKKNKVISILEKYMGFNCACGVAEEINKIYNKDSLKEIKGNNENDINEELCPICGSKLEFTYDINRNAKPGEDPRIYGVICTKCLYERYDEE
jgi:hypothetical protein